MICPVEIAGELSALRAARVGDHAGHGKLLEGRDGAGDESTGSDFAGRSQEDQVVAGGGNYGHQRSADATGAGAVRRVWLPRAIRPAAWETVAEKSFAGGVGARLGAVSGALLRFERAPLSREADLGAPDRAQLQLGEGSAARSRPDRPRTQTRGASAAARAAAFARHAVAHRRQ